MALTRVQVEGVLIDRVGKVLTAAGLDGTTESGNNPDLNDPIGWAIRTLGHTVGNITAVNDSDLANVSRVDALLDLAELRALENVLNNYTLVDSEVGPRSEDYSDLADRLAKWLPTKRKAVERQHKLALGDEKTAGFRVFGGPGWVA